MADTTLLDMYIARGCTKEEALTIIEKTSNGAYPYTPLSETEKQKNKRIDDWILFADENHNSTCY